MMSKETVAAPAAMKPNVINDFATMSASSRQRLMAVLFSVLACANEMLEVVERQGAGHEAVADYEAGRSLELQRPRLDIRLAENPIDLGAACGQIPVELGEIDAGLLRCDPPSIAVHGPRQGEQGVMNWRIFALPTRCDRDLGRVHRHAAEDRPVLQDQPHALVLRQ